jgi:hypothetical protein
MLLKPAVELTLNNPPKLVICSIRFVVGLHSHNDEGGKQECGGESLYENSGAYQREPWRESSQMDEAEYPAGSSASYTEGAPGMGSLEVEVACVGGGEASDTDMSP